MDLIIKGHTKSWLDYQKVTIFLYIAAKIFDPNHTDGPVHTFMLEYYI